MWGFLTGTIALIALQTLVQPAAANKLAAGSGVLVSTLSRLLSDSVAGLPRTKKDASGQNSSAGSDPLGDAAGAAKGPLGQIGAGLGAIAGQLGPLGQTSPPSKTQQELENKIKKYFG